MKRIEKIKDGQLLYSYLEISREDCALIEQEFRNDGGVDLTDNYFFFFPFCSEVLIYQLNDSSILEKDTTTRRLFESKKEYEIYLSYSQYAIHNKYINKTPPYNVIYVLIGGEVVRARTVSEEVAKVIILNSKKDDSISGFGLTSYRINDDTFVVTGGDHHYQIFGSYDCVNSIMEHNKKIVKLYEKNKSSIELIDSLIFNQDGSFIENKDGYKAKLSKCLGINIDVLDFSLNSLKAIEVQLYENVISFDFSLNIADPLLYYFGEVFMHQKGGIWHLYHESNIGHLIPCVIINQETILIHKKIAKLLDPTSRNWLSLLEVYRSIINSMP
ncbi:hypothetical protein FUA23_18325 [Neolewinella aurantiaca]|uniref:Uncharacterized protein n=1 Tax=Neolewinella aurantiaca TaxID=2602767 RepID=A0A5C7FJM5_9BACT|nr:hypothetical protein [Neolewinella aurantiaca]TXF87547.1 hypothetical protein FUA23_18325 [Neolewinella aurantiaca]